MKHETQEYSVGIIGLGFVGKAMLYQFPDAEPYDPKYPIDDKDAYSKEIIFICVPTDEKDDGSCDTSIVERCIQKCPAESVVVIKSTVPPTEVSRLKLKHEHLVFNPEFLTERNWQMDVENESRIILGGKLEDCKKVARAYQKVSSQEINYIYCTAEEAMMTKYVNNAFLATKVAFANEMYDVCEALGMSWDKIREMWITDRRVGKTHTLVTERRGFGGYCLPKDTAALDHMAHTLGVKRGVLRSVIEYNRRIRNGNEG